MSSNFPRLRTLFDQCVDLPEGERLSWIERHVPDPDERIGLSLMLLADARETDVLQQDLVRRIDELSAGERPDSAPDDMSGRRFGPFRLVRLLGRGGQGEVYLAERCEGDFAQTVAVKLLRRSVREASDLRRFRREREILARFEHPGVARLVDGGVAADGLPYLAMEYVDGESIERWCKSRALDTDAILRLFSALCAVVAAAHRSLIVHRDLKPSNVLVARDGAVKVLDFGIARLLDGSEEPTQSQLCLMTPGYGAPEQAHGGAITPASDVHALGVILRQLLTGEPPARERHAAPNLLPDEFPAELRWVIERACMQEPELRYRDAAELREDVERFLHQHPVLAHPPSGWYRVRKFAARHRGGVVVSLLLVMLALAGFASALWQAREAREQSRIAAMQAAAAGREAARAKTVESFLIGLFAAAEDRLPRNRRPTPEDLVATARAQLAADAALDDSTRADLLFALAKVSGYSGADRSALEGLQQAAALIAGDPARRRDWLAMEAYRADALRNLGDLDGAARILDPVLPELEAVADPARVDGLVRVMSLRLSQGRFDEALVLGERAMSAAAALWPAASAQALGARLEVCKVLVNAGRFSESEPLLSALLDDWQRAGLAQDADFAQLVGSLAVARISLGQREAGLPLLDQALALRRAISPGAHEDTAALLQSRAAVLYQQGKRQDAEVAAREALAMNESLYGHDEEDPLSSRLVLATIVADTRGLDAGIALYREVTDGCARSGQTESNPDCARAWTNLANALLKADRLDEALAASTQGMDLRRKLFGAAHPQFAVALIGHGSVLNAMNRMGEALTLFDQAIALRTAQGLTQDYLAAVAQRNRARALLGLGRPADALQAIDLAQPIYERLAGDDLRVKFELAAFRALALAGLGQRDPARAAARSALAMTVAAKTLGRREWDALRAAAR